MGRDILVGALGCIIEMGRLETIMPYIVGWIVMWDITPRGTFYYRFLRHWGRLTLGRFITFMFCSGMFCSCIGGNGAARLDYVTK